MLKIINCRLLTMKMKRVANENLHKYLKLNNKFNLASMIELLLIYVGFSLGLSHL